MSPDFLIFLTCVNSGYYCQNYDCFSYIVFLNYIKRFCNIVWLFQPYKVTVLGTRNV